MTVQLKEIVKAYHERKEQLEALEEEHEKNIRPIKQEMALLESAAHKMLVDQGTNSSRTDYGTAFRQKWSKAKVTDMEALWEWATKNNRRDVFNKAVNKTVVMQEVERVKEETGEDYEGCPIPGVEIERGYKCQIRKSP